MCVHPSCRSRWCQVGRVRYSDLSPRVFFEDYVAPRRPVVMDGCLSESEGWRAGMWTNAYLREKVPVLIYAITDE